MSIQKRNVMQAKNSQLFLTEDDHKLLLACLKEGKGAQAFNRKNAEELEDELRRAKLVKKEDIPQDVVRINSTVKVKVEGKDEEMMFTLVMPDKANIKEKKISVFAPVGTALLGFRKGQHVQWEVPAGKKSFVIMEVMNE